MATKTKTDPRHLPPIPKAELAKVEKPEKVSVTAAGWMDVCPRAFFLYYRHKGGPQSHAMARGECWHDFKERFLEMLRDSNERSAPPEVGKDLMNAVIAERKDLVLPAHEQHALRGMAWNYASATVIDPDAIVGLEQMLELDLGNGHIFRGRLDYAEISPFGYMLIEDDKSGLHIFSADEVENGAKGWQSWAYPLLAAYGIPEGESFPLGKGIDEFHFRFTFNRFLNEETGELIHREVVRTRDQLADFRITLTEHFERIDHGFATGEFPASAGSHCSMCPARAECPIPDTYHEIDAIETVEEAEKALEAHFARDAEQRRLMRSVAAFHEDYAQPIYMGDYVYDRRLETRRSVDWDAVGDGSAKPEHIKHVRSTPFKKKKLTKEEREARA